MNCVYTINKQMCAITNVERCTRILSQFSRCDHRQSRDRETIESQLKMRAEYVID